MTGLPAAFLGAPLAHRALHDRTQGRPENSRAAIRAAVAAGYGVEIDVQLSTDHRTMVFHDYRLERLTGETGAVHDRTAAELGRIALTGGADGIPTLEEVAGIVSGRAALLVEIKDQDGTMGPDIGALEQAVARALAGYSGPVAVMSFNPHSVAEMARVAPGIPRGRVTSAYRDKDWPDLPAATRDHLRAIADFGRVGESFISHEVSDLDRARVGAMKAQGVAVLCWTVKSPTQEVRARRIADNITFEGYKARLPG